MPDDKRDSKENLEAKTGKPTILRDEQEQYSVGYGRPPQRNRFQKGQSGNPKGRPRGSKNIATLLDEALSERVPINENGVRRTISMRDAITKQTVHKAAKGNDRFIKLIFELDGAKSARDVSGATSSTQLDEDDQKVLQDLLRSLQTEGGSEGPKSGAV